MLFNCSRSVAATVAVAVAAVAAFDFKLQYIMCGSKAFALCRRHVVSLLCFCCCFLTSCCCCRCCCDGCCCCCFLAINWYFSCPRRCQLCYFLAMKVIPNAWHSDSSQAKPSWAELSGDAALASCAHQVRRPDRHVQLARGREGGAGNVVVLAVMKLVQWLAVLLLLLLRCFVLFYELWRLFL